MNWRKAFDTIVNWWSGSGSGRRHRIPDPFPERTHRPRPHWGRGALRPNS